MIKHQTKEKECEIHCNRQKRLKKIQKKRGEKDSEILSSRLVKIAQCGYFGRSVEL